jgi:hypothetical protein
MLTAGEIDLIKTTIAHCRALSKVISPWVSEHDLRVASASLRFLLVDDNLVRAWRASRLGGPIVVEANCFSAPPDSSAVAFCGGAEILPGVPVSISWGDVDLVKKRLNLKDFLNSACIYFKGTAISRHNLIKYVANTKGGSHYDPGGVSPKSQAKKFEILRTLENEGMSGLEVAMNGRNPVHHELASVIQSIISSPELQKLSQVVPP